MSEMAVGDHGRVAYSSHGEWSTLKNIRDLELERNNEFPKLDYPDDTPAIWVTWTKRTALRYLELASEWERLDDPTQPLTPQDLKLMEEIAEVHLLPSDIIAYDDGDGGYLILRPLSRTDPEPSIMPGVRVRFLKDIPASTGLTGQKAGPYVYAAEYVLPKELADFHVRMGDAEYVRAETKRPTLHDLFSGATLDVYLEAARTRPLVAAEMERQATRRWTIRAKATDLGKQIQGERESHGL